MGDARNDAFSHGYARFTCACCEFGLLPCILCVDVAGLRRKRVTFYLGGVYKRIKWLAGSTARSVEV
ncbi:MAG: hypothetical protein ACYS9C_18870 [Planctomycetota bacterium]